MDPIALNELIAQRRAIYPPVYTDTPITASIILQLLENANWAPTHKRTEPWRFQVFREAALSRLADYLAEAYTTITPADRYSDAIREKTRNNILRADTVIVLILQRDLQERVPEWEEIAALGAAVQNLWLSATAFGIGGYWSTPGTLSALTTRLNLPDGQRCMGLFYLGHYDAAPQPGIRGPVADKTVWHLD